MLNMSQINDIRERVKMGYKVAEIARELGVDEKTIRKYKAQQDYSPRLPISSERHSKLDPFKPQIDEWLAEDRKNWFKQKHTAKRIHDLLLKDNPQTYDCSYNLVHRYVRQCRQEEQHRQGVLELQWPPGHSQVDFGEADFIERGEKIRKKYLTVSFPYSNDGYSQVFGGETSECVCQGLKDIFAYIGGVPSLLVFDNATGVGRRIGEVIREAELFRCMRAHYNFSVRFCNPQAGHEKGHVENKVGYNRRNLFVPLPAYDDIEAYNRELLKLHEIKAEEVHYKKQILISKLFEEDRQALLSLPQYPFDVCRYVYIKADGYGKIRVDEKHYYSTRPEYAYKEVLTAIRAHTIDILEESGKLLVSHNRSFGEQRSDSNDYRTTLAQLMRNVGAWKNSGLRHLVSEPLRAVMDEQPREELQKTLRTMHRLSKDYDFETAVLALEEGLKINRTGFHDAAVLAARMAGYGLDTAPEQGPDLSCYDQLLQEVNSHAEAN